jgi:TPR repeat protein
MRCVFAALIVFGSVLVLQPLSASAEETPDLTKIIEDETPEQLCQRAAPDPFTGFGPDEWAKPFGAIDAYRAVPACVKAMRAHLDEDRYMLGAGLGFLAGEKEAAAKKLLNKLVGRSNTSAMLALAYVSAEEEAAGLMRKAAEQGNATGILLYGMSLLTGKGVSKDEIEGVRRVRRAAEAGSTRAMLILANFYKEGTFGVGYDANEGKRLIEEAARRGDPRAKHVLAGLEQDAKQ